MGAVGMRGNTSLSHGSEDPKSNRARFRERLTKPFRNSKLHIRATMLLKIKGNFVEATMSLKTMGRPPSPGPATNRRWASVQTFRRSFSAGLPGELR